LCRRPPIGFFGYGWESDDRKWNDIFLLYVTPITIITLCCAADGNRRRNHHCVVLLIVIDVATHVADELDLTNIPNPVKTLPCALSMNWT